MKSLVGNTDSVSWTASRNFKTYNFGFFPFIITKILLRKSYLALILGIHFTSRFPKKGKFILGSDCNIWWNISILISLTGFAPEVQRCFSSPIVTSLIPRYAPFVVLIDWLYYFRRIIKQISLLRLQAIMKYLLEDPTEAVSWRSWSHLILFMFWYYLFTSLSRVKFVHGHHTLISFLLMLRNLYFLTKVPFSELWMK